jgi:hypothetical protein
VDCRRQSFRYPPKAAQTAKHCRWNRSAGKGGGQQIFATESLFFSPKAGKHAEPDLSPVVVVSRQLAAQHAFLAYPKPFV